MLFGTPSHIVALAHPAFTGVDGQTGVVLKHARGELALLLTSVEARSGITASINGTKARIEIDGDFLAPNRFRLVDPHRPTEVFDHPHHGRGLRNQAAEFGRCLRDGETESPVLPLDETLSIMQTLDEIRRRIGVHYPVETAELAR